MPNDPVLESIVKKVKERAKATWTPRFPAIKDGAIFVYPEYVLEPDGRLRATGSCYFYPELEIPVEG